MPSIMPQDYNVYRKKNCECSDTFRLLLLQRHKRHETLITKVNRVISFEQ